MGKSEKPRNPEKENECIYAAKTDINSRKIKSPEKLVILSGDFCQIVRSFFLLKFGR
jgi:hypothetical protein